MSDFNKAEVPFTITATNLNLADTQATVIYTFPTDDYIRVPRHLLLAKDAGTAYTLDTRAATPSLQVTGLPVGNTPDNLAELYSGDASLVVVEGWIDSSVEDASRKDRCGRVVFRIPLQGFLDSTAKQTRVVLPEVRPRVYRGNTIDFRVFLTTTVSGGTGSLRGSIHFDEIAWV